MCRPSRWFRRTEVERGHSKNRRLHFGKGMQSTRGWPRSTSRFWGGSFHLRCPAAPGCLPSQNAMRMDQPAAIASGLYLVRMEQEGVAAVARVVLVR